MVKERTESQSHSPAVEEIAIDGFDHVEFYVGNALQSAYYFQKLSSFIEGARKGPPFLPRVPNLLFNMY